MQKNDSIIKVAQRIVNLKKQLDIVTELKEKAFIPCNPNSYYKINELLEFLTVWSRLYSWTRFNQANYGCLIIKNYNDLSAKFNLLTNAHISRAEFCSSPVVVEACEAVEKYIDDLKTEISKQEKQLDTLYNQFVKATGQYSFIFKEIEIKRIIISKLLMS